MFKALKILKSSVYLQFLWTRLIVKVLSKLLRLKKWRELSLAESQATGEVSEWLKEHAWKACVRQKRTEGSNPSLSAWLSDYRFNQNKQKY